MHAKELNNKTVLIWGTGREGKAAATFVRKSCPELALYFLDEGEGPDFIECGLNEDPENFPVIRQAHAIAAAIGQADVIIKSPGVSLYHPLLDVAKMKGTAITSLLNLWLAEPHNFKTIAVTGTKGKSTTTALFAHVLKACGKKVVAAGNIGLPLTEAETKDADYVIIETSSYQAASLDQPVDIGVLTTLFPEHLDWHGDLQTYYHDKLNLLRKADHKIINGHSLSVINKLNENLAPYDVFNSPGSFHAMGNNIYFKETCIGPVSNPHLARPHNLANICAVLTALQPLGFSPLNLLEKMADFKGLPHRQFELGIKDGLLYVDDSISTTPQSAIAAMEVYKPRPITLIAGGFDRGIDYSPLVEYAVKNKINGVICMGPSGKRISAELTANNIACTYVETMPEAVKIAREQTPQGGVILLSPAAPSYGLFKDFIARGLAFSAAAGF